MAATFCIGLDTMQRNIKMSIERYSSFYITACGSLPFICSSCKLFDNLLKSSILYPFGVTTFRKCLSKYTQGHFKHGLYCCDITIGGRWNKAATLFYCLRGKVVYS